MAVGVQDMESAANVSVTSGNAKATLVGRAFV
jgi:hypothetical protein